MRISGFKFKIAVAVNCDEFKDECESGKGINANAHINLELGEAEVTPEETREMLNSVNELIHSELNKEIKKNKDIKFLEKELDKKNKELYIFINE